MKSVILYGSRVRGEAKDADLGIAGGKGYGLLFRKGKVVGKVKEKDLVKALMDLIME